MSFKNWIISSLILLGSLSIKAQSYILNQNHTFNKQWQSVLYFEPNNTHFGSSLPSMDFASKKRVDSIKLARVGVKERKTWFGRKLLVEPFVRVDTGDFYMEINPAVNGKFGRDLNDETDETLYTNTRGVFLQGHLTDKISFYSSFYENQSFFPQYMDSVIRSYAVVPGEGRYKGFKNGGFDYAMASGVVQIQPTKWLGAAIGHDRLNYRHGYRSLFLSDHLMNYPFMKLKTSLLEGIVSYETVVTWFQESRRTPDVGPAEDVLIRKNGNFHYLSFKPSQHFELGIFEGSIFKTWDDSTGKEVFNYGIVNPLPFYNYTMAEDSPGIYGIIGAQFSTYFLQSTQVYGQIATDENGGSGFQLGVSYNDEGLFTVGVEYNKTKELYRASNGNDGLPEEYRYADYQHFNQPLGNAWGGDTEELIARLQFQYKRFLIRTQINYSTDNDREKRILRGDIGYILNPSYNAHFYLGGLMHSQYNTEWLSFGFKTALRSNYLDF
jgi:hypothetical protein